MFRRVLIANRGEIALRVQRACRELDIAPVIVCSEADRDSLPVQLAEHAYCIGPARAADSYLNTEALLTVALATGCQAVHPGYGFLAESAEFAEACEAAGLTFIGPPAEVIREMGRKASARARMKAAGVPVVPGSDGPVADADEALRIAEAVGWPVLIKASAGGGGLGIRRVSGPDELPELFEEARAEAVACFGDGELYLEKQIESPRHIEFQILADAHGNIVQLGDRECSVQRRNQKLIEEAPSCALSPELRREMSAAALTAARAAGCVNACTVEFVTDRDGRYYFIEMNTRIQVEHGVTEMVTGIDLVREQIRIAQGLPLSFRQDDVVIRGHAIECRINAEDPMNDFRPSPGTVSFLHFPGGCGVRVDSALFNGCEIPPFYDSLIAKIICSAPTRKDCMKRMRRALEELVILGPVHTADLMHQILHHPDFVRGHYDTGFLEKNFERMLERARERR